MADIFARLIFFVLDMLWVVLVLIPLWLLHTIFATLYKLTSWSMFARVAKAVVRLDLKCYALIRHIATTWLTEEKLREIELKTFGKDD